MKHSIIFLLILLFLNGCSIEKRLYSKGYNINYLLGGSKNSKPKQRFKKTKTDLKLKFYDSSNFQSDSRIHSTVDFKNYPINAATEYVGLSDALSPFTSLQNPDLGGIVSAAGTGAIQKTSKVNRQSMFEIDASKRRSFQATNFKNKKRVEIQWDYLAYLIFSTFLVALSFTLIPQGLFIAYTYLMFFFSFKYSLRFFRWLRTKYPEMCSKLWFKFLYYVVFSYITVFLASWPFFLF